MNTQVSMPDAHFSFYTTTYITPKIIINYKKLLYKTII